MNTKTDKFYRTNLQYIIDYDYERSGCTCNESICRCTTIKQVWIENIHVNTVIEELLKKHCNVTDSEIDKYCFDRICYAFEIYNKDLYEIEVRPGYYGEEIHGIYFENEEKVFKSYQEIVSMNSEIEKIKYCLELEYGYLINSVDNLLSAYIIKVSPNNIIILNKEYFIKLYKNVIESYKDRTLPIAVCIKDGKNYRLIDGYHRFIANKDKEDINIVVLE